jgi:hypothetical protein
LVLAGVVATTLLARQRLTISPIDLSYRSFTTTIRVPIARVPAIHAAFGKVGAPIFALIVETAPGSLGEEFHVNLKPFNKRELRVFFQTAKDLGIVVKTDSVIAKQIGLLQ